MTERPILAEDAATFCGQSLDTLYRLASKGGIPHRRPGGTRRLLFFESELVAWLNGCELEQVSAPRGGRVIRPKEAE